MTLRRPHRFWLAGLMLATGVTHLLAPRLYERIIPRVPGGAGFWVSASGAAQLVGGLLLAHPRTRRLGAWWVACVLVLVFPANVKMAMEGGLEGERWPLSSPVAAWLRLPLQAPLVVWALREARAQPVPRSTDRNTSSTAPAQSP
ncbi:MAG: hypothetical protein M3378_12480 [Actinomycetota bacterium]|nr:hypothetical protein [Actinomycetota bacterium]